MHPADFAAHSKSPWVAGTSSYRLPLFPPLPPTVCCSFRLLRLPSAMLSIHPPPNRRRRRDRTAIAAQHRLPAPLAARAQPATASRHHGHTDPTYPTPPLIGRRGVSFRCWVFPRRDYVAMPCQADPAFAAYPYSPRALRARHAAADGLRRIISSLAGCSSHGWCELDIFILLE